MLDNNTWPIGGNVALQLRELGEWVSKNERERKSETLYWLSITNDWRGNDMRSDLPVVFPQYTHTHTRTHMHIIYTAWRLDNSFYYTQTTKLTHRIITFHNERETDRSWIDHVREDTHTQKAQSYTHLLNQENESFGL